MNLVLLHPPVQIITSFESIGEIIAGLRSRGYETKFRRETSGLHCFELSCYITPDNFTVDEYYHYEDNVNTDRERWLYAVSSTQGLKGFFVDSYFVYEDNISHEMAQKLKT